MAIRCGNGIGVALEVGRIGVGIDVDFFVVDVVADECSTSRVDDCLAGTAATVAVGGFCFDFATRYAVVELAGLSEGSDRGSIADASS